MLYQRLVFEAVRSSEISSVYDLNLLYFISLMIEEDIPYFESAYLLQLMVQILDEIAFCLMKILTQHEMAPNTFHK